MDLFYRTFVTTPILCYVFGMHDCMLAIVGGLASITTYVVTVILFVINKYIYIEDFIFLLIMFRCIYYISFRLWRQKGG